MTGKNSGPLKIIQQIPKTLPAYQEDLERIKSLLKTGGSLAVLFVDAGWMNKIEQMFGRKVYGEVLESLIRLLVSMRGKEIRADDLLSVYGIEGEQFLIFLSRKEKTGVSTRAISRRFRTACRLFSIGSWLRPCRRT